MTCEDSFLKDFLLRMKLNNTLKIKKLKKQTEDVFKRFKKQFKGFCSL